MTEPFWEDLISINPPFNSFAKEIDVPSRYVHQDDHSIDWGRSTLPLELAISRDTSPLPATEDREGYYGENHFNYWASGLRDVRQMMQWMEQNSVNVSSCLDIGCSTGRILRHLHYQGYDLELFGCDINRRHIDWMAENMPKDIIGFQNSSIPSLPLPDESIDLVTAFSVFTHIESFDTSWLMELRRILRKGGIAWISIHSERVWRELAPDWPLYRGLREHADFQADRSSSLLPRERCVYRWRTDRSYTSNIFYSTAYIEKQWGRILDFKGLITAQPAYQDIVILQK